MFLHYESIAVHSYYFIFPSDYPGSKKIEISLGIIKEAVSSFSTGDFLSYLARPASRDGPHVFWLSFAVEFRDMMVELQNCYISIMCLCPSRPNPHCFNKGQLDDLQSWL